MRYYVNELQNRPKPVKVFYFGSVFRYERPQSGRYREFFQFGAELVGAPSMESDAEIIALALWSLEAIGLKDTVVRIGNLDMLKGLLGGMGVTGEDQNACRRLIDKADFEGLGKYLDGLNVNAAEQERLSAIIRLRGGAEAISKARELADRDVPGMEYLGGIFERLAAYGFANCTVDFAVARGLDYYTGMVFEIDSPGLGAEKQICGGGAYQLAELFGGDTVNSTGYAFGFDRLMLALDNSKVVIPTAGLRAYIVPIGEAARPKALEVLRELRAANVPADMDLMGRSISKAMAYANSVGAEKAIIIGDKELAEGTVTVRDMKSGEQTKYPASDVLRGFLKGVI
jgi:histidyl-tRNA synthetase